MRKHHRPFEVCPNCQTSVKDANFCPNCGQENHDLHLPAHHIILESLESIFHFETKFFKTVKLIFKQPGQITRDFIHGKRVSQFHPFRLYVFTAFLFFMFLTIALDKGIEEVGASAKLASLTFDTQWKADKDIFQDMFPVYSNVQRNKVKQLIRETDAKIPKLQRNDRERLINFLHESNLSLIDTLRAAFPNRNIAPYTLYIFDNNNKQEHNRADFKTTLSLLASGKTENPEYDATRLQRHIHQNAEAKIKTWEDILTNSNEVKVRISDNQTLVLDSVNLGPITLNKTDALEIPTMSSAKLQKLLQENNIHKNSFAELAIIRINAYYLNYEENPKEFIHVFIKKFSYLLLLMMPFLALLLKFFYFQSKRFYYEHLIFSIHLHVIIFLFVILILLSTLYFYSPFFITVTYLGLALYGFLAFQNFYRSESRGVRFKEWLSYFGQLSMLKKFCIALFYLIISPILVLWVFAFGMVYLVLWLLQQLLRVVYKLFRRLFKSNSLSHSAPFQFVDYLTRTKTMWEFSKFSTILGIYGCFIVFFTILGISMGYISI